MTTTQTVQINNWDMNCIRLDISMWSGRSKFTRDDLKDPDAVPSEAVASLGTVKLVDPDGLKKFAALKRRAIRACEAHGTLFMGGYIVDKNIINTLDADLVKIKDEYDKAVTEFCADYDKNASEWLAKNSQWAHILRPRLPSPESIARKFSFDWAAFRISPVDPQYSTTGTDNLSQAKQKVHESVIYDIAVMLRDSGKAFSENRAGEFTGKTFNNMDKAIRKCDELSFTHPDVGVLGEFLREFKKFGLSAQDKTVFRAIYQATTTPESLANIISLSKSNISMPDMAWALNPNVTPAHPTQVQIHVDDTFVNPDSGTLSIPDMPVKDGLDGTDFRITESIDNIPDDDGECELAEQDDIELEVMRASGALPSYAGILSRNIEASQEMATSTEPEPVQDEQAPVPPVVTGFNQNEIVGNFGGLL